MIVYFDVNVHDLHETFFSLQLFLRNKIKIFLKHIKHVIQRKHATSIFFVYTEKKDDVYIVKNESIFDVLNRDEIFFLYFDENDSIMTNVLTVVAVSDLEFCHFSKLRKKIDRDNHENKVNRFQNVVVFTKLECELLFDFVSNALLNFVSLIILNYQLRM